MVHEVRLRDGAEAILQRPISDAEFTAFDAIYAGTAGPVDARLNASFASIADSDSADSARTVLSFYQVFYGRQPDAGGFNYWTDQLDSGAISLNGLASEFSTASEFDSRFGDRQPVEVVAAQYFNVLGRAPDAGGLAFWADQVQTGALSLADLGRFFATSDEAQARFDPFIDAFLVNTANGEQDFDTDLTLFEEESNNVGVPSTGEPIDLAGQTGAVVGTNAGDIFSAESGDLSSASNVDGGGGLDTLTVFNETQDNAISPRMTNVETVVWTEQTNDRDSDADNNVGGYSNGRSTEVDVELDAGRISGVTRWEDFDSRADLVIEDIRDDNDVDGTFTGDLTVAMVSTDPGNVDYATYFDQPVNVSTTSDSIFIELIDQNNSNTFSSNAVNNTTRGSLEDARLDDFSFVLNDQTVTVVLDRTDPEVGSAFFGPAATYTDLLNAINAALDNTTLADGTIVSSLVQASFGGTFFENIGNDNDGAGNNSQVFGRQIVIDGVPGASVTLADAGTGGVRDFTVTQLGEPADIAASVRAQSIQNDELIRLNIELDDVGKGSMGGDLLAGAMSTGRQVLDDGTSDSQGIQQFDIEVDRSSQLQTINSTNNALEVVNIVNGENDGPNNTTTATDEQTGDLVVRGRANPDVDIATDNAMPGAFPQHNDFGFSDVRVINAAAMVGSVDLTLDLTDQVLEKYLDNQDTGSTGNSDNQNFNYDLGANDDKFLVNMSSDALLDSGTASREDFRMTINGGTGDDSIVTNVGEADKEIDDQGQDYYDLDASGEWYSNQANNGAATFRINGGDGDDTIWTNGWGDFRITGGDGFDSIYTDNSGTVNAADGDLDGILDILNRGNIGKDTDQIDYQVGAVWTFNDDNGGDGDVSDISGSTNFTFLLPGGERQPGTNYNAQVTVSFFGADGADNDETAYTSTVTISNQVISADGRITEQELNQAIKNAVNTDPVLSKVLEAVDGPGQSLAVYSKIDGDFDSDDLQINLFETRTTGGADPVTGSVDLDGSGYDTTTGTSDASDFQNFGSASDAESDNTIVITADGSDDVIVLSTGEVDFGDTDNESGNLNGASNEILRVEEGSNFGTETIFNFGTSDDDDAGGEDSFDFVAINFTDEFSNGSLNQANNSVSILERDSSENGNNTAAKVEDLFDDSTFTGGAREHIVIVYNDNDGQFATTDNTGTVYLVNNPSGAAVSAVEIGDINLIGTDWSTLDVDNFL